MPKKSKRMTLKKLEQEFNEYKSNNNRIIDELNNKVEHLEQLLNSQSTDTQQPTKKRKSIADSNITSTPKVRKQNKDQTPSQNNGKCEAVESNSPEKEAELLPLVLPGLKPTCDLSSPPGLNNDDEKTRTNSNSPFGLFSSLQKPKPNFKYRLDNSAGNQSNVNSIKTLSPSATNNT